MNQPKPRRRWLWWVTIPVALLLIVAGTRLMWLFIGTHIAGVHFTEHRYEAAAAGYQNQAWMNPIDPWKAPYNQGTALLFAGSVTNLRDAVSTLTAAYSKVSPEEPENQCLVQTNLALTHEIIGDRAITATNSEAARQAARHAYQQALDVRGWDGCPQSTTADQAENEQAIARLTAKLDDAQPQDGSEGDTPEQRDQDSEDPTEAERQQRLQELKEQSEQEAYESQNDLKRTFGDEEFDPTRKKW